MRWVIGQMAIASKGAIARRQLLATAAQNTEKHVVCHILTVPCVRVVPAIGMVGKEFEHNSWLHMTTSLPYNWIARLCVAQVPFHSVIHHVQHQMMILPWITITDTHVESADVAWQDVRGFNTERNSMMQERADKHCWCLVCEALENGGHGTKGRPWKDSCDIHSLLVVSEGIEVNSNVLPALQQAK